MTVFKFTSNFGPARQDICPAVLFKQGLNTEGWMDWWGDTLWYLFCVLVLEAPETVQPGATAAQPVSSHSLPHIKQQLWNEECFHGRLSRRAAERLLVKDGDFLVRESITSPGQYVLSGLQGGQAKHLLLVDPEGKVWLCYHCTSQFSSAHSIQQRSGLRVYFSLSHTARTSGVVRALGSHAGTWCGGQPLSALFSSAQ